MANLFEYFKNYISDQSIFIIIIDVIFLTLIGMFLFSIIKFNNRAKRKFYLVLLFVSIYVIITLIGLPITSLILKDILGYWPIFILILYFNEIRLVVENFEIRVSRGDVEAIDSQMIKVIMSTIEALSKRKTGALITFERSQRLDDFISKAIIMNADISQELIESIFNTLSPTHDGAVIIQNNKIACAGAYYPPSNSDKITKTIGSRHRAALGISELYDCLTIVVSEETGRISITVDGYIERNVNKETLQLYLNRYLDL